MAWGTRGPEPLHSESEYVRSYIYIKNAGKKSIECLKDYFNKRKKILTNETYKFLNKNKYDPEIVLKKDLDSLLI